MAEDDVIRVEIEGLKELRQALLKFPDKAQRYLAQAGQEAADRVVLKTRGLKDYPPETEANRPPVPYYRRGYGMQYTNYNTETSEKLGTQFYTKAAGYGTEIGNRASYARYVVGDEQAHFMSPKGWRKLRDVVIEKMELITKVYQAWVDKLLKDVGL